MTELLIRKSVIALRNLRDWLIAKTFFGFLALLKLFPAESAIWFISEAARGLGPKYPRSKRAISNLELAFPDNSDERNREILSEMWANLGRLVAEYVYLDQILKIDPENPENSRVEFKGEEKFLALLEQKKPVIFFTAHTGNWEILPVASSTFGMNITALFRPPNNKYIAEKVLAARTTSMGDLVPSKVGASWALANVLENGGSVGMLIDQHYARGLDVSFFNHTVKANPLLAKLARQFDCPVYPARSVRLPDGRFRIEIEDEVVRKYKPDGTLDVARLTQDINTVVERWVTEYPEQWLWLHRRWRNS